MFSESHSHLRALSDEALKQVIKHVEAARLHLVLVAGIDLTSSEEAILIARKHPLLHACVGIHPWNADSYSEGALSKLQELARNVEVVAISEIGLDYVGRRDREGKYVTKYVDEQIQREAFRNQLRMAKVSHLPVLVHDRTPNHEVIDLLDAEGSATIGAAIHGFSKDISYAERCIKRGIYLSIGLRPISVPENEALREAIRQIPLEWLLTETDSGRPDDVVLVAEKISKLKGLTRNDVGRATTKNLKRLLTQG